MASFKEKKNSFLESRECMTEWPAAHVLKMQTEGHEPHNDCICCNDRPQECPPVLSDCQDSLYFENVHPYNDVVVDSQNGFAQQLCLVTE